MLLLLLFFFSIHSLLVVSYPRNINYDFEIELPDSFNLAHFKVPIYKFKRNVQNPRHISNENITLIIHPIINVDNSLLYIEGRFCKYHIYNNEECKLLQLSTVSDLESYQRIDLDIFSPSNEFDTFQLTWHYYKENIDVKLKDFCGLFNPISFQVCRDKLKEKFLQFYEILNSHYEENSKALMQKSNIWENIRDNVTVVNPREYLIPVYKFLSSHSNILLNRPIEEVLSSTSDLTNFNLEDDMFINLPADTKSELFTNPSLHIVIATTTKVQLFGMIATLQELTTNDYLTIIFDGSNSNDSKTQSLQNEIKKYALNVLDCQVHFIHEDVPLGYWGHGARNKYNNLPGDYDFVIHADDDDAFTPNSISTIKKTCRDKNTLYLFKLLPLGKKKKYEPIWTHKNILTYRNVGTQNGVIPKAANQYGRWGHFYGGDAAFYISLVPYVRHIEYIDFVTYMYFTELE